MRVGEEKVMHCGLKCKCIAYRKWKDCDFEFENGYVIEHAEYGRFEKGTLVTPELKSLMISGLHKELAIKAKEKYLGKTFTTDYGYTYTIIEYIDYKNIKIRFNDDYEMMINHKQVGTSIMRPDLLIYTPKSGKQRVIIIGEKVMQKCGLEAELLEYISSKNCTVKIDGKTKSFIPYKDFAEGNITSRFRRRLKVGDTFTLETGEEVKIIAKNSRVATIQFANGKTREILARYLKDNSNIKEKPITHIEIGTKFYTNCGMWCKIIKRSNTEKAKYDIEYEDGKIKFKVALSALRTGQSNHPDLKNTKGFNVFHGFKVKREIVLQNKVYYGIYNEFEDIIGLATPQELIAMSSLTERNSAQ